MRRWPVVGLRAMFVGSILLGVLLGALVSGVRCGMSALDNDGGDTPASPEATAVPGTSPRATAEAFAAGWSKDNIEAIYSLLDAPSQQTYPLAVFKSHYSAFANETTQRLITATVTRADGNSATLHTRLDTAYFGTIEYSTALRFTDTTGRWLITWDPTLIHPDLTDGRTFRSIIQRPSRGTIFDRNGVELAVTRDVRMLGLNRSIVGDREALTRTIESLGFSRAQVDAAFASTLGQTQRVPIGPIPDNLAETAALLIGTPGLLLYFDSQRVHPLGAAAAHVVGYTRELTGEELAERAGTGFRPGDRIGAIGVERSMEGVLAGKVDATLRLQEPNGATVKVYKETDGAPGQDVTTTLDADTLRATHARLGIRTGAAVVIDPQTNEVLALNSSPSYDPDAFERNDSAALNAIAATPNAPLANRATTGLYSAGSTFKLFTGAAGLMSGSYKPTDEIFCGASWSGIDPPRRNWEGTQGPLTIAEGLMRSCNPVFYEIGLTLYNDTDGYLSETARQFGFGAATGIVGIGEEEGLVPDAQWKRANRGEPWYPGDEVNLSIGQGDLLITPLQLANAYSAFINRELRTPVMIAGNAAESKGKIEMSDAAYSHLKLGLQLVTSQYGTASAAFALSGYNNFLGKSGTAEDAGAQQHVLFVALAPVANPRAIGVVVLDEGQSGSIEAGPIARDIVLAALN